jgi:hypothetical protein
VEPLALHGRIRASPLLILRGGPGGESALSPKELVENYRPFGSLTQYLMIY